MKKLYLVRHAKSSWDQLGIKDFERQLMPAGIKRTKNIIEYLQLKNVAVDLIIASPAIRTFETAKILATGLDYPIGSIQLEMEIYNGVADDLLNIIRSTDDKIHSLMIVGHNPTMTYLSNMFLLAKIENLPTTGVVAFSFQTDEWEKIRDVKAIQEFYIYPKLLK